MSKVTNKELNRIFRRGIIYQLSWNYERMQALGYCYTILPILRKMYAEDADGLQKAVRRNLEFFNTHPYMAMPIIGTTLAMEEHLVENKDFSDTAISSVKISMMGPLAGIGDSLFWFTIFPITAGIGVSLAKGGNIMGPIVFLLLFNVFNIGTRYFGLKKGYELGTNFIDKFATGSVMTRISESATIIGLMVLGVMSATMVVIPLDFVIGKGEEAMSLQDIFDSIMPNLLPLLITLGIYKAMKKGMSATKMLLLVIALAILGALVGLFK